MVQGVLFSGAGLGSLRGWEAMVLHLYGAVKAEILLFVCRQFQEDVYTLLRSQPTADGRKSLSGLLLGVWVWWWGRCYLGTYVQYLLTLKPHH